jgi:hypothetical protein
MVRIFLQTEESVNENKTENEMGQEHKVTNDENSVGYVEMYTLAVAWILFETLIRKNLVRKHNRGAYLSTCILISFK